MREPSGSDLGSGAILQACDLAKSPFQNINHQLGVFTTPEQSFLAILHPLRDGFLNNFRVDRILIPCTETQYG